AVKQTVLKQRRKRLQRALGAMHIEMPDCPFLHIPEALVHSFRRGFSAGMDSHRNIKFLDFGPEGIIVRVAVRLVRRRKRNEESAPRSILYCPLKLASGFVRISH